MKKLTSLILTLCLLLCVAPVWSTAETYDSSQERLLQEAREVFPEYADRLHRSQAVSYSTQSMDDDAVVYSETRSVSEKETLGLTVMRSGNVVVTKGFSGYTISSAGSSSSQIGSDIIGSATFTMTCTAVSGTISVSNIGFIIHQNKTGYFTSYGSLSASSGKKIVRMSESTTGIHHGLIFNADGTPKLYMSFDCYFENGRVVGEISG